MSDEHPMVSEKYRIGDRVWALCEVDWYDGPIPSHVHHDNVDLCIPDHPALPAVAAELARQGDEAMAVVMRRQDWEWVCRFLDYEPNATHESTEASMIIRRQLDAAQRAPGGSE